MWTNDQKVTIANTILTNINPEYHLDFWQEWYICQKHRFTHTLKSRRVGYSYVNGIRNLILSSHPRMYRFQKVFVSYNMTDSMEKIKETRNLYMNMPDDWRKELKTDSKTALEFWDVGKKSVSQIISIPSRALRGFGTTNEEGGCLIDEAPVIQDVENIYTSAIPTMARGGTMDVGGTPMDKNGLFYEIYANKEKYPNFTRIEIPWWYSGVLSKDVRSSIKPAWDMPTHERVDRFGTEILQTIFSNMGLHQFQQEFELEFQDQNEAFITMEMIMSCTPQKVEQYEYQNISEFLNGIEIPEICTGFSPDGQPIFESVTAPAYDPEIHGLLYAGWDMGRTKDASVFTLLGHKDGKLYVWMSYELKNTRFDEQKEFAAMAMDALPIRRFLIDRTGLGMDFAEWAETKFPTRAEGVHFTNETKEDMANKVYLAFERQEYVLPMNRKLHADVHCIRKTLTATKHSRYDGSTKDSHADRFWSLALATMGVNDKAGTKSRFYEGYKKNKDKTVRKTKRANTGNPDLDRLLNSTRRRRHGR